MGVPGPQPYPLIGTMWEDNKLGFVMSQVTRMQQYGKLWGTFRGNIPNLFVTDQNIIRDLLVKQFPDFTDRRTLEGLSGDMEDALVFTKGNHWKNMRPLLSPTFSSGKLKKMTPLIVKASNSLMEHLSNAVKTDPEQDMKRVFGGFSMDVIASTAFGVHIDSNKNPNDPFVERASRFLYHDMAPWQILVIFIFPSLGKLLGKIFGIAFFPLDVQEFFRKVIYDEINRRSTRRSDYADFLQLMMDAHLNDEEGGEKKGLTSKEILANAMMFFAGGYEATASTLSFLTYELSRDPMVQENLYREIMDNIGDDEPGYDNINNLFYLDMCIDETLRKYPPFLRIDRICTRDTYLHGLKINKGMIVSVPTYAIQNSSNLWEDPESLIPTGFHRRTKQRFLPFGHGPRNCLGMRLAFIQIKLVMANIVKKFRFSETDKTKIPDDLGIKGFLAPNNLWLKAEVRQ